MTYSEKLRDPRWQKKRLEVLESAGWKCEFCGDPTNTLHVHHLKYKGDPWDAPMKDLECLCEKHHNQREGEGVLMEICFMESNHKNMRSSLFNDLIRCIGDATKSGMPILEIISRISKV